MKYAALLLLSVFGLAAFADSEIARDRYVYIGSFDTENPFKWDEDSIISNARGFSEGIVFDIRQGVDVEVDNITVICRGGRVCARIGGGVIRERRPVYVSFRRDLDVRQIILRSRPLGFSVPPTRVDVFLEQRRGW